jgi:hypothetical protein
MDVWWPNGNPFILLANPLRKEVRDPVLGSGIPWFLYFGALLFGVPVAFPVGLLDQGLQYPSTRPQRFGIQSLWFGDPKGF